MKKNEYLAPEVEIVELVEQVSLLGSSDTLPPFKDDDTDPDEDTF